MRRGRSAVRLAAGASLMALLAWFVVAAARTQAPDDGYIVWRFVDNLVRGFGWAFTRGDAVSGCTSPLQVLTLAAGCALSGCTPQTANAALSFVALTVAGCAFAMALQALRVGPAFAWLSGAAVVLMPLHRVTFGLEGHLQVACLGLFWWAWSQSRWSWAGVLAGLAVLARPDAVLALGALALPQLWRAVRGLAPWRPLQVAVLAAGLVLLPWFAWSWSQFGELLPNTLAAKQAQGASGAWQAERFLRELQRSLGRFDAWGIVDSARPFCGLAVLGAIAAVRRGVAWPWFVAAAAHAAAYRALGVPFFHWYALPLHLAVVLAPVTLASAAWPERWRRKVTVLGALLLVALLASSASLTAPKPQPTDYERAGTWLAANTPSDTRIACYEIGQLGWAVRPRPIVDLAGLVTPALVPAIRQRDFAKVLDAPPDVFVLHELPWPVLEAAIVADPRFAGYERVGRWGTVVAWRRR